MKILLSTLIDKKVFGWIKNPEIFPGDLETLDIQAFYDVVFKLDYYKDLLPSGLDDVEHCVFCGFFDNLEEWKKRSAPEYIAWHGFAIDLIRRRNKNFPFHTYYTETVNEIQRELLSHQL